MKGNFAKLAVLGASVLLAPYAVASTYAVGYISYDVTDLNTAQFDVVNLTGAASSIFPDTSAPILTPLSLSGLGLDVSFPSGPDSIYSSSYWTLDGDGYSWDGSPLSTITNPPTGIDGALQAVLTGTFASTTLLLNDGVTWVTINPTFSATLADPSGLADGDLAIIYATTASTGPVIPEPPTYLLLGSGLLLLLGFRYRRVFSSMSFSSAAMMPVVAVLALGAMAAQSAQATTVRLSPTTVPSSSTGGSNVTLAGTGYPAPPIAAASTVVNFSATCGGAVLATEAPNSVTLVLGTSERLSLLVPTSLASGPYFISVSGHSVASVPFASGNCAVIQITNTSKSLAACLPTSSLAVLTGANVTAYVPHGSWDYGTTGIGVVPVEGAGAPALLTTAGRINSCSSNAQTGETVCVDGGTGVYLISGSSITGTLSSGANSTAGFSGGSCANCGVAIDSLTNTAYIAGGFAGPSNNGIQALNLNTNTFSPAFGSSFTVSENISVDPTRNLILSPNEDDYYMLYQISPSGALTEYANYQPVGGEFDSGAEDCTTGIALSTQEFTNNLFITDLTQAVFTAPSGPNPYGTWTAPSQSVNLYPSFDFNFSAGTSGISVAPGTTHLGITEGEFGGNTFAAFQLPATSGSGTPNFVDWVGATLPPTPDSVTFSAGTDPHTITAYTSPNNGKAYGLIAGWNGGGFGQPNWLAKIDLAALLAATRSSGDVHIIDPSVNLLTSGIVTYIPIP